jgi:hypothetical protein
MPKKFFFGTHGEDIYMKPSMGVLGAISWYLSPIPTIFYFVFLEYKTWKVKKVHLIVMVTIL